MLPRPPQERFRTGAIGAPALGNTRLRRAVLDAIGRSRFAHCPAVGQQGQRIHQGWRFAGHIDRDPFADAHSDGGHLYAVLPGHVRNAPPIGESAHGLVVRLLLWCCPPAVLWRVVPVYIDTVDGEVVAVPIGQRPVSEGLEGLRPLFAKADATTTVVWPASCHRVRATGLHAGPGAKEARVAHTVSRSATLAVLREQASARHRVPGSKPVARHAALLPAIAKAAPSDVGLDRPVSSKYDETAEAGACQVNHRAACHRAIVVVQHLGGWAWC